MALETASANTAEAESYEFKALASETHQIRLLRLEHASEGSMQGTCIVQSLDSPDLTPYEAVSYVWGNLELCETITVDGQPLAVTRNAFEMLASLRRGKHQYLWIDAICINQRDVAERSHQVQQMSRIYALASRVIIYLGRPTTDTDLLMGALSDMQRAVSPHQDDFGAYEQEWSRIQARIWCEVPDAEPRQRQALEDILSRPYWNRVWIIQEISQSVDGVVYCGDTAVSCDVFVFSLWLFDIMPSNHISQILGIMPTRFREAVYHGDDHHLRAVLMRYHESKASDERDRIYALLGLVHEDSNRLPLVVDYSQSEAEVVRYTIVFLYGGSDDNILPLEVTPPTVAAFLECLHKRRLRGSLIQSLARSTHPRAVVGMEFMLQPREYGDWKVVTPSIVEDAARNPVHDKELSRLLWPYTP